jgi:hypothetical protein
MVEVSITTDSEQYKIMFVTYVHMHHGLIEKFDDKGFVLKEIQEMKGGSTFRSMASKNDNFKEDVAFLAWGMTTTQMAMKKKREQRNHSRHS